MTTRLSKTVYLTVHGHFYQPPRENPWTDRIGLQPSAAPFHDWNERILIQCYQPNAMARIVDREGKVLEMVNNFRLISFNVGATLLSWLEKSAPIVYRRILEGDRRSIQEHTGHGNALAQVYNHMILPLADERDQRTQIRWGIYEFKKRFGRDPEGIWLPETAASERTLEILIEERIRFTILAPEQANQIRRIGQGFQWEDVSKGSIDPTRPYRSFHTKDPARFIDLFFFEGPLSRDVSFGDILFDAKKFLSRILHAHRPERNHPELIHLAADGETFGHHKAFGERVITFLLHEEAERHGIKRTNYGEYLEKFPPQYEVKIKPGEGTSWSCFHGIGRWKEDCGCRTGGEPGWNQKWRKPLREAVQHLQSALAKIYEEAAEKLFQDPWKARDHYIELVLDHSQTARDHFFEEQESHSLSSDERIKAFKLLEMERFGLLAQTSCGWFFNDISGIETVQILCYALRAMELASEFGGVEIEKEFVRILSQAKSNRTELGDGQRIWEKLVKPNRVSIEKIVSHYAIRTFFDLDISRADFYNLQVEAGEIEREENQEMVLLMGTVRVTPKLVPEPQDLAFAVFQDGFSSIACFVKRLAQAGEFGKLDVAPLTFLRKKDSLGLLQALRQSFASEPFSLSDFFPEERNQILWFLSKRMREDLYEIAARFYDENRPGMALFREASSTLPEELRGLMEWMMGQRLVEVVQKLKIKASFEEISKKGKAIIEEARSRGFAIKTEPTTEFLSGLLNAWIEKLFHEPDLMVAQKLEKILELARELQIRLHDRIAQDLFFVFTQKVLRDFIETYRREKGNESKLKTIHELIRLGSELGFNMKQYEDQLSTRAAV